MTLIHFLKSFFFKFRQNDSTSKKVFDHYFFDSKYYLHPTASIEDFSSLLNISPDELDHISKVFYNCLFKTLLNEYRYTYFLNELKNPINSNLPMDSIIKLSGYDDKNNFLEVVKNKSNSPNI
jgi:AraC-like DNA-binding protein